jgi:hypothetical protein
MNNAATAMDDARLHDFNSTAEKKHPWSQLAVMFR